MGKYLSPKQHFDKKMKIAVENRDFNQVARLFHLYGCYLELVAEEVQPTKELVHLPNGEAQPVAPWLKELA